MRTLNVTIHRPSYSEDDYGNQEVGGYTQISSQAYRIAPLSAREIARQVGGLGNDQGQQTLIVSASGAFPPNTDIQETDELTANGKRYKVVGVFPVPSAIDPSVTRYVRADLEAVS
jgi:hypothetical protein